MNQPLKSAVLILTLSLALVGCGPQATAPEAVSSSVSVDESMPAESQTLEESSQPTEQQSDNTGLLAAQSGPVLGGTIKYPFKENYCNTENGFHKMCVAPLMYTFDKVFVPITSGNATVYIKLNEIQQWCKNHRQLCINQANQNMKNLETITRPPQRCGFDLNRRRRLTLKNQAIKYTVFSVSSGLLISAGKSAYGLKPENGTSWSDLAGDQLAGAIVVAYNDLGWQWYNSPGITNFGDSFIANVVVFGWAAAQQLPGAIRTLSGHALSYYRNNYCGSTTFDLEADIENSL